MRSTLLIATLCTEIGYENPWTGVTTVKLIPRRATALLKGMVAVESASNNQG
jgi:hypothetical protein